MERRYSVPPGGSGAGEPPGHRDPRDPRHGPPPPPLGPSASEDLHAWSIYRQNLNSDFTDSALGSSEKSPLPYGNFQLRESTVQSILSHPRYGPKSALGSNMYTYLKFGLPRVFPPGGRGRDGSSGYDSSDDGSPQYLRRTGGGGGCPRSRSDPDFRASRLQQPPHGPPPPHGRHPHGHGPRHGPPPGAGPPPPHPHAHAHAQQPQDPWSRGRSVSEANLLSQEAHLRHLAHRRSMHDLRPASAAYRDPYPGPLAARRPVATSRRRASKTGSQASLAAGGRRGGGAGGGGGGGGGLRDDAPLPMVPMGPLGPLGPLAEGDGPTPLGPAGPVGPGQRISYYTQLPDPGDAAGSYKYPHLQVRGLEVESAASRKLLVLAGVSFEAHGGEILAVMATSEEEGTTLLDVVAGRATAGRLRAGDVLLNGQSVRSRQLRDRVAYVQSDSHLHPDLTVRQTLAFHRCLRRSPSEAGKLDVKNRINALVEDLGLEQVRHTKVAALTTSERRRLNVACHLLLDTELVLLDRPTLGMDIFDTFFLVEFLRQWAGGGAGAGLAIPGVSGGRIVMLTLHPPTYEIFTMLSRVVLLSAGRAMFAGRRRDMLPYFALVEYPCPAYKNPSDYYLDLVTLDDLSAEAMLESSQRIEQLAEEFGRRREPLADPGPPVALPPKIRQAGPLAQAALLLARAAVWAQPLSLTRWLARALLAAALSVCLGAVFWDVPGSDPQLALADRLGFHVAVALLGPWPLLLALALADARRERWVAQRDVRDRLYGRGVYFLAKVLFGLPASAAVWIAYLVPAYLMSGLHVQGGDYYALAYYVGLMLLWLLGAQMLATAAALLLRSQRAAGTAAALLLTALALLSGLTLHPLDLPRWAVHTLPLGSPARWLLPALLRREHRHEALPPAAPSSLACRRKQVQHQDIIVQLPCPAPNGTAALEYMGMLPDPRSPSYMPAVAAAVFWFLCFLLAAGAFLARRHQPRPPRSNPNKP